MKQEVVLYGIRKCTIMTHLACIFSEPEVYIIHISTPPARTCLGKYKKGKKTVNTGPSSGIHIKETSSSMEKIKMSTGLDGEENLKTVRTCKIMYESPM